MTDESGRRLASGSFQLADGRASVPMAGAYWVIAGRLLAGSYPGHPDPATARDRIRALARAGIRHYVNLMFDHEVDHSGRRFAPYEGLIPSDGSMVRFPIEDVYIPTVETMVEILDHLDGNVGEGAYVHCWGGVGRTGTVIGCWLIRHGLADADSVLDTIAGLREQDTIRGDRSSPETFTQRRFVLDWQRVR